MEIRKERNQRADPTYEFAYICGNPCAELNNIIKKSDWAKHNGEHSFTNGLPEDFGGSIYVKYASGETIDYSCNQSPVLSAQDAQSIYDVMRRAFKTRTVSFPPLKDLIGVEYTETKNDAYVTAKITNTEDGSWEIYRKSCYEAPQVYESRKTISMDTVNKIKSIIDTNGLLGWSRLPKSNFRRDVNKSIKLIFKNETVIVPNDRYLPDKISGGFFNIELIMTLTA